jgi:hypothetical protein
VSSDDSDNDVEVNEGSEIDHHVSSRHSSIVSRGQTSSRPPTFSLPAHTQNAKRKRAVVLLPSPTPDTGFVNKKKKKKVQAGSSIADPMKWVFLVPNDGESGMKELKDLSREARDAIEESFEDSYFPANNTTYRRTDRAKHDAYASMVHMSNRRAHLKSGCVMYFVHSRQGRPHQWTLAEEDHTMACDRCARKGTPCADMIEHDGEFKLCFHPRYDAVKEGVDWAAADYWVQLSE